MIERFQPEVTQIELGSGVSLEAVFTNGKGILDPEGGALDCSGVVLVAPVATTTYTLTVTNGRGESVRRQATVVVKPGLAVTVEGYEGGAGEVRVTGPGGFTRTMVASGRLTGLEAGEYTIEATPARHGAFTLHPWQPLQTVTVHTGTAVTVNYPAPTLSLLLPGGVPLDFILIPAGRFTMGSDDASLQFGRPRPCPAHLVAIPNAYYLAKVPTTQAQWQAVAGDPMLPQPFVPDQRMDDVSYDDIHTFFLPRLKELIPRLTIGLPSEAHWERACRAGTTTAYFFGQEAERLEEFAWRAPGYAIEPHPVGQKKPNPWGLFDLSGLGLEWCEDYAMDNYQDGPTDGSPRTDPESARDNRILRGGGPFNLEGNGKSAIRYAMGTSSKNYLTGFRLEASLDPPSSRVSRTAEVPKPASPS